MGKRREKSKGEIGRWKVKRGGSEYLMGRGGVY